MTLNNKPKPGEQVFYQHRVHRVVRPMGGWMVLERRDKVGLLRSVRRTVNANLSKIF